jgi:hypothetical protein
MNKISKELAETIDSFIYSIPNSLDWAHKSSPDKWSAKEIIGHLTDSAHINLQRFIRCTYEENFKLIYFQDEWVAAQHYQEADTTELLLLWRLVNKQIVRVLDNYPADRWQATCDSNRGEPVYHTVEFLANDYTRHLQHHLNQIISLNNGN